MTLRCALIMAGGTGGHIFPALAVAALLKKRGWRIVWLGAVGKMETQLVPYNDPEIIVEQLNITGVRGNGLGKYITLPWVQGKAIIKAIAIICRHRPKVVIGFGGFTSFAGGIASKLLGYPLVIHEQNALPGLTNRLLAKVANCILFAFPSAFANVIGLVGNPVRTEFLNFPNPKARFSARTGPLKILVIGGSLGASILNEQVPRSLAMIPPSNQPIVVHQAGNKHITQLIAHYHELGVKAQCIPFIDNMAQAIADADLVICRAGGLTIAELTAVGVAAIIIPFAAAVDNHQMKNAQYLSVAQAAIVIAQSQLSAKILAHHLNTLTREDLLQMAENAYKLAKPQATQNFVAAVEKVIENI